MAGARFRPSHTCAAMYPDRSGTRRCRACAEDIPLGPPPPTRQETRLAMKDTVTHYSKFTNGLCGELRPRKTARVDKRVTCEKCLMKRLAILGAPRIHEVSFERVGLPPKSRVELLQRLIVAAKRLKVWAQKKDRDEQRRCG